MHLGEDDASDLKSWVVVRLKDISDADSDVLADYVLALIRTDTPDPELKPDVLENLKDFLKDNTSDFVDEIFRAIQTGSYKPGYAPPRPNQPLPATTLAPRPPGLSAQPNQRGKESRKRSYNEAGLDGPDPNSHYAPRGDRQMKQMRGRGVRGGRGNGFDLRGRGFHQDNGYNSHAHSGSSPVGTPQSFSAMPTIPGMPQFDPNDPMAAILAMQAMGMQLPGMEGFLPQQMGAQRSPGFKQNGEKDVCRDYVNKGYCTRGDACPYQHTNPVVVPGQQEEYDPENSIMSSGPYSPIPLTNEHHLIHQLPLEGHPNESRGRGRGGDRGRGRGRGGNDRGGFRKPNRAEFSHSGPNHDRSITTIVVEQIPEEKFSEDAVREFFSEFGSIEDITMQPYKRLALVKYSDYFAARAAYDSPKVIFDNRFVKVYWYKPGSVPTPPAGPTTPSTPSHDMPMKDEEPPLDLEAFAATAAAAQAKLDAKKAAQAAMHTKRSALEKQKADLATKQATEKQKLLDRLAAKGQSLDITDTTVTDTTMADITSPSNNNTTPKAGDSAHTLMLRAKVAALEAEAKSLGLPDSALSDAPSTPTWSPRGRGRGRGRGARGGSYRGWENLDPSYRGGGRGAGSPFVPARGGGGGKYNLDLRTKRVAVSLVSSPDDNNGNEKENSDGDAPKEWTPTRDESLRQHILSLGEFEDISLLQGSPGTLVVAFKDRGTAEGFLFGVKSKAGEVAGLGRRVNVSWFNGPTGGAGDSGSTGTRIKSRDGEKENGDVSMGIGNGVGNGTAEGMEEINGERKDISSGNAAGAVAEMRGGGQGEIVGAGEGDYDVAEEDDDSWMT